MLGIKKVEYHQNYELYIELSNGVRGIFDVAPYLKAPFFQVLENVDYFKTVQINFCGIAWPKGQDFSADTIEQELLSLVKDSGRKRTE